MKLLFFGRLRDSVGLPELDCSPPTTIVDSESLLAWIGISHPSLNDPAIRIAIDDVLVRGSVPIEGALTIAFLPPVSGG